MKTRAQKQEAEETTAVVARKSTAVALPQKWQDELAKGAKDASALEQPETLAFSTKSGVLSYNGTPMPDNETNVIILAAGFLNSLYINKFDPNNIVSPLCFAVNATGEEMSPHENSFKPQNEGCVGCENAEWGSDENSPSGRGKACKETRRLAVIPASALEEGLDKASIAILNVPVTSVGSWGNYVHTLAATAKRPAWSVITKVKLVPDVKNQFKMVFEAVDVINDGETLESMASLRDKAMQSALTPFAMMSQEQFDAIQAEKEKPVKKRKF
jgi:hypothetical protein